ncbi:hypothetical protein CRG98_019852 [Punica granatum]|uniref:Uncharacterized protein n=1 Tax=Punica granatum TaxID=22663 RepID=A0A2I0JTW5_PUNGR|nr:hypothetical protein CRG98_019852 [Punica granatum]
MRAKPSPESGPQAKARPKSSRSPAHSPIAFPPTPPVSSPSKLRPDQVESCLVVPELQPSSFDQTSLALLELLPTLPELRSSEFRLDQVLGRLDGPRDGYKIGRVPEWLSNLVSCISTQVIHGLDTTQPWAAPKGMQYSALLKMNSMNMMFVIKPWEGGNTKYHEGAKTPTLALEGIG